jgi:hypothetical protein
MTRYFGRIVDKIRTNYRRNRESYDAILECAPKAMVVVAALILYADVVFPGNFLFNKPKAEQNTVEQREKSPQSFDLTTLLQDKK